MLNLARMLKSTIHDGSQDLWLQKKISETTAVDGDVVALNCALLLGLNSILGSFSLRKFLSCNGFERVVCYLLSCLLLLVVQKIFVDISISHGSVLKLFLKERERLGAANGISVKFFSIEFC